MTILLLLRQRREVYVGEFLRVVFLDEEFVDTLGPAINSGRSLFLYGEAGNGKTTIATRMPRCVVITPIIALRPFFLRISGAC